MQEAIVVLGNHRAAILTKTCNLERCPYGVAAEELVVGWYTCELHHAEFHYQMVYQLLCLLLSQSSSLDVTVYIYIKECRHASYRHGGSVLCLHSSQIAEIEPLHSLARIGSRA